MKNTPSPADCNSLKNRKLLAVRHEQIPEVERGKSMALKFSEMLDRL